jgi:hypothetical protein
MCVEVMDRVQAAGATIMPYTLRWEGHGVYRRFFGVISAAEFLQAYEEMCEDPRYDGIRYLISDYLEAEPGPDITERDLKAFAELERLRFYDSPDTVQATVATSPKTLAYVRYYESLRISPYCMGTFSTVAEAREWIASNPRQQWRRPRPGSTHAGASQPAA